MAENIIVRQDNQYRTEILATDPETVGHAEFEAVVHVQELTPYGMLLASLGSCTAILLNSYAQNRNMDLEQVELHLHYARNFQEDCENCEEIEEYGEHIEAEITLSGNLTDSERERLFTISHQCPIEEILTSGIDVELVLREPAAA